MVVSGSSFVFLKTEKDTIRSFPARNQDLNLKYLRNGDLELPVQIIRTVQFPVGSVLPFIE